MFNRDLNLLYELESDYSQPETCDAIVDTVRLHTATVVPGGAITMQYLEVPPKEADIYFSTIRDERVVITAGNRIKTFWQITFDLTARPSGGVHGVVRLDRPRKKVDRWMGDVQEIQAVATPLHINYGFKISRFKY